MKKYFITGIALQSAIPCKVVGITDRWIKLTTVIGAETFTDYIQFTGADSCGYICAKNEYGSTFSGMRRLLTDWHWLTFLHKDCDKYYIDEWVFDFNPTCYNAKWIWQTGVIRGDCRCKLRGYSNPSSFVVLKKGEIPPGPTKRMAQIRSEQ